MFDKISDAAEKVAANVSRRHFLDSLGRWAGATALAMAGVLTTTAGAGAGSGNKTCCFYSSLAGGCSGAVCLPLGTPCPPGIGGAVTMQGCGGCRC